MEINFSGFLQVPVQNLISSSVIFLYECNNKIQTGQKNFPNQNERSEVVKVFKESQSSG